MDQLIMKHQDLTAQIIKAFYNVYNTLGYGFLESVYENAMQIELTSMGLGVHRQRKVVVYYNDIPVGRYCPDMIVEDVVLCEFKATEYLVLQNELQLFNYLKATEIEVGLLLNFGKEPEIKRKIYDNDKKRWRTSRITRLQDPL